MKYKGILIFICFIICLLSIAGVCASDVNQTAVANDEINHEFDLYNTDTLSASVNDVNQDSVKMSSQDEDTLNLNDNDEKVEENENGTVLVVADLTTEYQKKDYLIVTLKDSQNNSISDVPLTYAFNTTKYEFTNEDGQIKIPTYSLNLGVHEVTINFPGYKNYAPSSATAKITVKRDSILNFTDALTLEYGTSANITVGIYGASKIIAKLDEDDAEIIGTTILIPKLDVGTHILYVATVPEENYNSVNKTAIITVSKIKSSVSLKDFTLDYGASSKVKLSPSGATGLTAKIDGNNVTVDGNEILISGLNAGTHNLTVTTIPDENHDAVTKSAVITVKRVDSIIGISDVEINYGSSANITVSSDGVTKLTAKIGDEPVNVVGNVINIPKMNSGNYVLYVTSVPDSNHNAVTRTAIITVKKVDVQFNVDDVTLDYGSQYNMTLDIGGSAKFTAKIDGKDINVIGNQIIFPKLDVGNHTLTVSTVQDVNHDSVTKSSKITINKAKTQVVASNLDATAGVKMILSAGMASVDLVDEGVIEFYNGNIRIGQANVNNGIATLSYTPTKAGIYSITAVYGETSRYEHSNAVFKLTVKEKTNSTTYNSTTGNNTPKDNSSNQDKPVIVIPPLEGSSGDGPFEIKFPSDTTGTVNLTVDGNDYTFEIVNAVANIILPELGNGEYLYTIKYSGDSKYNSFTTQGTMKIKNDAGVNPTKTAPEITIPSLEQPSQDKSIEVKLPTDAAGTVTLKINNANYNFAVVNGVAKVVVPDLGDGKYMYTIKYSGDSKYSSFTKEGILKVNETTESKDNAPVVDNSKITASNVKVTYAAGQYYTIKVYGTDGKLANGVKVVIKLNGKKFQTLTTAKGVAKFKVANVPGTYKLTITALGKSVTKTLTVNHLVALKSVAVKKSAKKLVLQANLGKVNGKYLKNKQIIFKFNGKSYKAKTNSKGIAKVTIKSTVLKKLKVGKKLTYQATYGKDTVKKTVTIKK